MALRAAKGDEDAPGVCSARAYACRVDNRVDATSWTASSTERWPRELLRRHTKCPQSGHVGEGAEPHASVRAMFLSLARFGIVPANQINALEKAWAAHRKQNGLDLYDKSTASPPLQAARCVHPQVR